MERVETSRAKHLKHLRDMRKSHAKWATWPRPEHLQKQSAGNAESLEWALAQAERCERLEEALREVLELVASGRSDKSVAVVVERALASSDEPGESREPNPTAALKEQEGR